MLTMPQQAELDAVRIDYERYRRLREKLKMRSFMADQLHDDIRFLLELIDKGVATK